MITHHFPLKDRTRRILAIAVAAGPLAGFEATEPTWRVDELRKTGNEGQLRKSPSVGSRAQLFNIVE